MACGPQRRLSQWDGDMQIFDRERIKLFQAIETPLLDAFEAEDEKHAASRCQTLGDPVRPPPLHPGRTYVGA